MKERIVEKFEDFKNALKRLEEGISIEPDKDIIMDGAIQRFEFVFELSWKLMREYLKYTGLEINNPRGVIKYAYQNGIIEDGDKWLKMLSDRNMTSHLYNQKMAQKIYQNIKFEYVELFRKLLLKFEEIISSEL
ncbi:nucleotidyltransferase substrate binding protein, HI0074 family [Caldicellulosiruptor acetigenus I77R1B]|uniref:Nucleotidyltransferase substrate binding protein, HI0074 family n=1 Tax=Caldicellulosiruptor acetigenus (strain ATCC 700853 / DSM 12137 / I77R1B) TaxID=632335 RepID=E4S4M4_CALA7|nr:nucleotidyltransferase substrate binding protein [Caldicellulosiruptor acetigenus]ADQ41427.1 nucleotidyltransferase substrate binding protein, HI0074 family [Caldicellulosiruptor acetigenus I77R1B]WAM35572.1 nucleotidyltransferase substrate binding protein [Caldicellulosiruptor acetigenus]